MRDNLPLNDPALRRIEPAVKRMVDGAIRSVTHSTLNPDDSDEIRQNVWMSLLKRKAQGDTFGGSLSSTLWIWNTARFEVMRHFERNHRYALYEDMAEIALPEVLQDAGNNPAYERISYAETRNEAHQAAEDALKRIRPHLDRLPEKPVMVPIANRKPVPKAPAQKLHRVIRHLQWSQQQMAAYLGVSTNVVNNYLFSRTPIPDAVMERIQFAETGLHILLPAWNDFLAETQKKMGLSETEIRPFIAERLGISPRTLRRWINGGSGSAKGLRQAIETSHRGWMRP